MDLAPYQIPDDRWKFFGFETLEEFCEANLVLGRFHPSVPTDVVEAYIVCEYIMTYSYYHYPLYYEAFSKVLRTIEMAVKIRCKQRDIPAKRIRSRDQVVIDRPLSEMMRDLANQEYRKDLTDPFKHTRNIRNIIMHPDSHTYMGAMTMTNMKYCVALLNKIFIQESVFVKFQEELEGVKIKGASFKEGLFILHHGRNRFLITGIEVIDVILVENRWIYLLAAVPVMLNPNINFHDHSYLRPLMYHVTDIEVVAGTLKCIDVHNDKINISSNDKSENESSYLEFKNALRSLAEHDNWMYHNNNRSEMAKEQIDFAYMYLHQVEE